MTKKKHGKLVRERKNQRKKREKRRKFLKLLFRKLFTYLIIGVLSVIIVKTAIVIKYSERGGRLPGKEVAAVNIEQKQSDVQIETVTATNKKFILDLKNMRDEKADGIIERIEEYPEDLLELCVKNPETLDFVYHYPEQKDSSEISVNIPLSDCDVTNGIPLFLQWDERWGYCYYGDKMIALAGCGPTCLSMVAVGLTGDSSMNPGVIAQYSEESGFLDGNSGTLWSLMTSGAQKLGLSSKELPLDEALITQEVLSGRPVICSMRPGDFTTEGHFIVLCGYEDGKFTVNDPNSRTNSSKSWSFSDLQYQIKNLWSFSE